MLKARKTTMLLVTLAPMLVIAGLSGCGDPARTAAGPGSTSTNSAAVPLTSVPTTVSANSPSNHPTGKDGARLGTLIHTGLDATPVSEFAIQGVRITSPNQPGITFGFQLLQYDNDGKRTSYVLTSAVDNEKKPGFRAVEHSYRLEDDVQQPAFGYFVGHPAKITGMLRGKVVPANTAVWSADRDVTIFWFDNTKVNGNDKLTTVQAYDSSGTRIAEETVYYE
ncbi:hypothetical protein BJ973_000363 [Actinoplanes tereljensis]|uniref:Lipoprotein n=1 Tax=Paractinoplanes tereljensis TaxID=571912 RepID=A0A919NQK2_9ACTN|nr:hypothetical protein [Actinoplanes tereljensis]GIF23281.1 hypothetical protein Ate02nite_60110 [Actinoplanes tereljensis]